MHVTPVDSRKYSVWPLFTRLFCPDSCPPASQPLLLPLFAPCLRSLCVGSAYCVRRRYYVGQVIRTVKRAF